MKKFLRNTALLFSLVYSLNVSAFVPETVSRSLVKITILENGVAKGTASGFVYKDNTHIITSLHVMKPGAKIKIEYNNMACNAEVRKVYQRGDLVLLEAIQGASGLPNWTPITSVNSTPLKFAENIFSVGYNSGSKSWISRKLSKGSGASEKLNDLIPGKDVTQIRNLGMPALDLNVIYIDGSLLPGFSGAPLLNDQGQLIGVADGGLENGASNVSWGIPSREIDALFASTISSLPTSIGRASVVFTAEVDAPLQTSIIRYGNYQFVHTKTRTLQQLLDRSDDRETLLAWLDDFVEIKVNYSEISFDIYEDIVNGFIITIPHGKQLTIENEMLSVKLDQAAEGTYYLCYAPGNFLGGYDGEFTQEMMQEYHSYIVKYATDYYKDYPDYMIVEDPEEYKIKQLSNGFIVTAGFFIQPNTSTEEHPEYIAYQYYKFIITYESSVLSLTHLNDVTTENLTQIAKCMQLKADCNDSGTGCAHACTLAHDWLQILASVNLTTVADNK